MTDILTPARAAVRDADALLITAGAGMGVDSGLPDFRGTTGFWRAYPRVAELGLRFEQMANPEWFQHDPHLAWAFYGHRLNLYRETRPHAGFDRLIACARDKLHGYAVLTSNVDGHFQRAGFPDPGVYECHGSIHHLQCSRPCTDRIWPADDCTITIDSECFRAADPLPHCPDCGACARPNILMFGDWDWIGTRSEHQAQHLEHWLATLASERARLAIIEIGAGTAVPTVRAAGEQIAERLGATLIRVNPREGDVPSGPHISLRMGGLEMLQGLFESSIGRP